ncbi:MAG: DMT family transporter [bacterium]
MDNKLVIQNTSYSGEQTKKTIRNTSPYLITTLLCGLMLIWGGSFGAIKIGLQKLDPMELVAARFIPSALLLLMVHLLFPNLLSSSQYSSPDYDSPQRSSKKRTTFFHLWRAFSFKEKILFLASSFFAVPGYHICLNTGETVIPSGWASLVISLNPTCITLLSALILKERVGTNRWVGLSIALGGLWVMILGNQRMDSGLNSVGLKNLIAGVVITLGAVLSWGLYTVLSRFLMGVIDSFSLLTWVIVCGTIWTLPWAGKELWLKIIEGSAPIWGAVAYLSVGCTVIGFIIWFWAIEKWEVSKVSLFIYLVPLTALLLGYFLFGEPLSSPTLLGALAILAGIILGSISSPTKHLTNAQQ